MKRLVLTAAAVALALVASLAAQQPAVGPTTKDPLRFNAIMQSTGNQSLNAMGRVMVTIERWSTDAERQGLVDVMGGARLDKSGGQDKLLSALQKVKPRTGFLRMPNSIGWDLRFCRENILPDGTRQIIIATDKPISGMAAVRGSESLDFPFTFLELRFPKDSNKGEGRMLQGSAIAVKDGRIQLENYGIEPVKLTEIIQEVPKK